VTDPPTVDDFRSEQAKGRRPRNSEPETLRLWNGISVYRTEAQARRKARALPILGTFIAAVYLAEGVAVRYERTTKSDGHYTLWGDAHVLLAGVVNVTPVRQS
jgi:hypothetical protein